MQQAICHLVKVAGYLKSPGWASLEASVGGWLLLKHRRMPKAGSSKNPAQSFQDIAIIGAWRGFYFIFRKCNSFPWQWWDTKTEATYGRKGRTGFSQSNQSVTITVEMEQLAGIATVVAASWERASSHQQEAGSGWQRRPRGHTTPSKARRLQPTQTARRMGGWAFEHPSL